MVYSQNEEERVIVNYFGRDFTGVLVDVGANDGQTFSNSRQLLLNGWGGLLVEPDPRGFRRLEELYGTTDGVELLNVAIGKHAGVVDF